MVANDEAAADPVQQNLMDMVVAEGVQTRYHAAENHRRDPQGGGSAKIFLVCKTPQDVLTLVRGGCRSGSSTSATCTSPREAAGAQNGVAGRRRRGRVSRAGGAGRGVRGAGCRMRRARRSANCS
ncbi:PTS sugar transporter subunit IIB [Serratia marcescens]|uniref:PTS sugar transporter subunit IIB n=1 Tax=Serratia marcescens TaxID=615 RepID=A0A939STN7_SERMA|nr:PTS sugar transporter subunit IIB [Serratia marcescens]